MIDLDTFLTTLYVMVDDFCQVFEPECRSASGTTSLIAVQRAYHPGPLWAMGPIEERTSFLSVGDDPLFRRLTALLDAFSPSDQAFQVTSINADV